MTGSLRPRKNRWFPPQAVVGRLVIRPLLCRKTEPELGLDAGAGHVEAAAGLVDVPVEVPGTDGWPAHRARHVTGLACAPGGSRPRFFSAPPAGEPPAAATLPVSAAPGARPVDVLGAIATASTPRPACAASTAGRGQSSTCASGSFTDHGRCQTFRLCFVAKMMDSHAHRTGTAGTVLRGRVPEAGRGLSGRSARVPAEPPGRPGSPGSA